METNKCIAFNILIWMSVIAASVQGHTNLTTRAPILAQNLTCDFESGTMCGWSPKDRSLNWIITNGSQLHGQSDHTLGRETGHFLTTLGKEHIQADAWIVNQDAIQGPQCIEFYLKTRSKDSSQFTVYIKVNNLYSPVYKSRGKHFSYWKLIQIPFTNPMPYEIVMVSGQSTGEIGQILIDDIKVTPGHCPFDPLSYVNVTCHFEDGDRMCGFKPERASIEGATGWALSNKTLPFPWNITDQTLGTDDGHCLISQLHSNSADEKTAIIRSSTYRGTGTHCLSFYYRMFSKELNKTNDDEDIGELRVYLVPEDEEMDVSRMRGSWTHGGHRGGWVFVHVTFVIERKYSVMFESVSSVFHTVYAIDDITIRDHACIETTPAPTTQENTSQSEGHTSTTVKYEIPTVKIGKQTEEKSDKTLIIGLVAGVGLMILIGIVVAFVARNRRKHKRNKQLEYQRSVSQDSQLSGQQGREFKPVAFSNPMMEATFDYGRHRMGPTMEQMDEANA